MQNTRRENNKCNKNNNNELTNYGNYMQTAEAEAAAQVISWSSWWDAVVVEEAISEQKRE